MCSVRAHIVSEDDLDVLCVKGKTIYDKYTCNEFKFDWKQPISIENEKAAVAAMTHSTRGVVSGFSSSLEEDLLAFEQSEGASVNDHHDPFHSALLLRMREKKALEDALSWLEERGRLVDEMIKKEEEEEHGEEEQEVSGENSGKGRARGGSTAQAAIFFQVGEIRALRKRQQDLAHKRTEWANSVRRTMETRPVLANVTITLVNPETGTPAPAHVVVTEGDDLKVVLARFAGEHGLNADAVASIEGAVKKELVKATPAEVLAAMQLIVPSGDVEVLKITKGGAACNETVRKFCALHNISMLPHDYPHELHPEQEEGDEEEYLQISSCGNIMRELHCGGGSWGRQRSVQGIISV